MTLPFQLPPMVEREMRVAARQPGTYWRRAGAALSATVVSSWVLAQQMTFMPAATAGQFTFRLLAGIAAFTVSGSVLQLSSEAFAREKREDTLGLLFLTPLRPIDLVIGKLVSTSLAAFYRFLAMIPALALPILVGGVTMADFAWLVLALINFTFLGATIGLYISARQWDEKRAATMALATLLGLTVLLPVLAYAWLGSTAALAVSPAFPIWQAVTPRFGSTVPLWASLLWTQLLAWIFFRAACRILPTCWQQRPAHLVPRGEHLRPRGEPPALNQSGEVKTARPAPAAREIRRSVRRQFAAHERAQMLDHNPLLWLARRQRPHSTTAWLVGAMACVAPVIAIAVGAGHLLISPVVALPIFFFLNAGCKIHVATHASSAFARDRGENDLELLLSTPMTAREMIHGYRTALHETLGPWLRRLFWIEVGWLTLTIGLHATSGADGTWLYVLLAAALLGFFLLDLHALAWTALWHGVIARDGREAEKEASVRILFLPWILAFGAFAITAHIFPQSIILTGAALFYWIVFSAASDWWHTRESRRNLETKLHLWALRRSAGEFEHYEGWRRAGRRFGRWWRAQRASR